MALSRLWLSVSVSCSIAICASACSDGGSSSGTGGAANGSGGATGANGGTSANGGTATANGGSSAQGGATSGNGGTPSNGGASTSSGGTLSNGGASTGGASTGGATTSSGGSSSGGVTSGGASVSGGSSSGGASSGGAATSSGGSTSGGSSGTADSKMNFFVSSDTDTDANLGGLAMADQRCQALAAAVGHGSKTWHAYLSIESPMTNARDRIGNGPYYNSKGDLLAADKTALHARAGDAALFLDEKGNRINGQWSGSPTPNQHDILTGTKADGTVSTGLTCGDWMSTTGNSQVGHSDGLGPNMATTGTYTVWNAAHTGQCGNTQPGGGAGRIYCFVAP
ncbi:MAG: hypothetical protein QM756_02905 [Polyangiaceae bacterium]